MTVRYAAIFGRSPRRRLTSIWSLRAEKTGVSIYMDKVLTRGSKAINYISRPILEKHNEHATKVCYSKRHLIKELRLKGFKSQNMPILSLCCDGRGNFSVRATDTL